MCSSDLQGRNGLPKRRCPGVEVLEPHLLQLVVLEIPLHGVELRHAVRDGCPRGKNDALVVRQLVHVAALHVHVAGLLCLGLSKWEKRMGNN